MTNHFATLGLEPCLDIDDAGLRRQFYKLQRQYHPDLDNSLEAAAKAADISAAYRILSDPDQRLRHVLELHAALPAEGQARVPDDFLMDMLDINEAIDEAGGDPEAIESIRKRVVAVQASLDSFIRPVVARFVPFGVAPADLKQLADYYLKRKYVGRLLERINQTLTQT